MTRQSETIHQQPSVPYQIGWSLSSPLVTANQLRLYEHLAQCHGGQVDG